MKLKRLAAALLAAGMAAMTLSGCFGIELGDGTTEVAATEDACRVGLYTPIDGDYLFTGAWGDTGADRDLRSLIYGGETVSVTAENTFTYNPSVISSVSISDGADGSRTYTYTLLGGLSYSDGSALTAKDYVFSVLLQSSPEFGELSGDNTAYEALEGYEAYASGETDTFTGVRWISDTQFSLTIAADWLPYYQEMLLTQVIPYPKAVLAANATLDDDGEGAYLTGLTVEALNETINGANQDGYRYLPTVTAGAYVLTAAENGVYTLEANPNYAGGYYRHQPNIQLLEVETARLDGSGDYDLIVGVTGRFGMESANRLLADGTMSGSLSYDSMVVSALTFDDSVSAEVRQALAYLIPMTEAADTLAGHWGQEALVNIPLASSYYTSCYPTVSGLRQENDPAAAELLLEEAGNGEPVILRYGYNPDDPEAEALWELLQTVDEESGLLEIQPVTDGGAAELSYTRRQESKSWNPWEEYEDGLLAEEAAELRNTAFNANSSRFTEKLYTFASAYAQKLPELPLAVYRATDLYSDRLIGYQEVDVYDDWTVWIQYARLVDLTGAETDAESSSPSEAE